MPQTHICSVQGLSFRVRDDTWDENIVNEVVLGNPYSVLLEQLGSGDVCLDIGAHIGAFTILAASHGARVYAFEPVPDNYALLVENIALNYFQDHIMAINSAVWSSDTQKSMVIPPGNTGGGGLGWVGDTAITVSCVGLSDFLRRENLQHCRGMKLDCEGSEYEILGSLSPQELQRFDVISLEYHGLAGHDASGLTSRLRASGLITRQIPMGPPEHGIGMLHAIREQLMLDKLNRLCQCSPLHVQAHLPESPYTRVPVIGWLWGLARRRVHELVVYYINQAIVQQNLFNQELVWALGMLKSHTK